MKAITRQPVWQLRCPHCRGKIRVEGQQSVLCCGVVYYLDLAICTEDETAWVTQVYEQEQAIEALNLPAPLAPLGDPPP